MRNSRASQPDIVSVSRTIRVGQRQCFLGAEHYERTPLRRGYANGTKPKRLDTPAGSLTVNGPKTAGHDRPFYPQSLERGRRSPRAVMLAVAEMYVKAVSTRDAEAVMREFGIDSLSSSPVSRAAKLLDDELEAWRNRPLGESLYLIVDARYEKMRMGGVVRDAAVLSAIGIGPDERRRGLGVSCALSEAEVHWRAFLESLLKRGMHGVRLVVSERPSGPARGAQGGAHRRPVATLPVPSGAERHPPCPNLTICKCIGPELRQVRNAPNLQTAEQNLRQLVESYRDKAPNLAQWLEDNIPEGLAVFTLPEGHRRRRAGRVHPRL